MCEPERTKLKLCFLFKKTSSAYGHFHTVTAIGHLSWLKTKVSAYQKVFLGSFLNCSDLSLIQIKLNYEEYFKAPCFKIATVGLPQLQLDYYTVQQISKDPLIRSWKANIFLWQATVIYSVVQEKLCTFLFCFLKIIQHKHKYFGIVKD